MYAWKRVAHWQKPFLNEIFKQLLRERSVFNLPCDKTIDGICRKNRPPFAAFKSSVFMRYDSNRCPAVFSVGCMLVCCRFIDEYKLLGCVVCQLTHPLIPQLWVTLCSTYLDLGIRKFKEIVTKKGLIAYLFF